MCHTALSYKGIIRGISVPTKILSFEEKASITVTCNNRYTDSFIRFVTCTSNQMDLP